MAERVAVAEACRSRIRIVEVTLRLPISVICASKVAEMRALPLVLTELAERAIRAVLVLASGRGGSVEVGCLRLAEIRRRPSEVLTLANSRRLLLLLLLLRSRRSRVLLLLLLRRLNLVEMGR